jgi:hypothetical protein
MHSHAKRLAACLLLTAAPAGAEMSLDEYLGIVKGNNYSYIGSGEQRTGAEGRGREADLVSSRTKRPR